MIKPVLIGIAFIILLWILYVAVPWIIRNRLRRRFMETVRGKSGIALTFDDGPDPLVTPRVLDVLKKHGANATFFVVAERVKGNESLIRGMADEGHEIGFHSYAHKHPWFSGPVAGILDIKKGREVFSNMHGICNLNLFRPPYGKVNLVSLLYIHLKRLNLAFWNVDPQDFLADSSSQILNTVKEELRDGAVLLFHDGRRVSSRKNESPLPEAVDMILDAAKQKNLVPKTISEMMTMKNSESISVKEIV